MGSTTDFIKRQTHLTPVVLVGGGIVGSNLSVFLVSTLKEMQAKSHTPAGVDYFDFAILLAGMMGSIAIGIVAFMNQTYGRWREQQDADRKESIKAETTLRIMAAGVDVPQKTP